MVPELFNTGRVPNPQTRGKSPWKSTVPLLVMVVVPARQVVPGMLIVPLFVNRTVLRSLLLVVPLRVIVPLFVSVLPASPLIVPPFHCRSPAGILKAAVVRVTLNVPLESRTAPAPEP